MTTPKRAVLYARVSTGMQERDGVSLEAQEDLARKFCATRGLAFAGTYKDVDSGSDDRRPELARLEHDMGERAFDAVLVYKIDRLSRDPAHYHQLLRVFERQGVGLASLTQDIDATTTMGRFILNIMIAVAEMEASQTADRIRDSIHYRARLGRVLIGKEVPIGYTYTKAHTNESGERVPGRLAVELTEAAIVAWIFERYVETRSAMRVVTEAAEHGHTWRTGRPLNRQGITRILRSPLYKGHHAALKTRTERAGGKKRAVKLPRDQWLLGPKSMPAIVSEELWEQANTILDENAKTPPRIVSARERYHWSGLLRCANCGAAMTYSTGPGGRNRAGIHRMYLCGRKTSEGANACAERGSVSVAFLDRAILPDVWAAVAPFVAAEQTATGGKRPKAGTAPRGLKSAIKERSALVGKLERLRVAYLDGDFGQEAAPARALYLAERAKVEAAIAELDAAPEAPRPEAPPAPTIPGDLAEVWARLEGKTEARGMLLRSLVSAVHVGRGSLRVVFVETSAPGWPSHLDREVFSLSSARGRALSKAVPREQ